MAIEPKLCVCHFFFEAAVVSRILFDVRLEKIWAAESDPIDPI